MEKSRAPFTVTTPCANCPFRTDVESYLRPERIRSIADSVQADESFYCHQTVDYDDSDEGSTLSRRARLCAGMMATVEREDRPVQAMRMGERLGMYNRDALDQDAPVYNSIEEWAVAKGARPLHPEELPKPGLIDDGDSETSCCTSLI
jgi:hypothetical protein